MNIVKKIDFVMKNTILIVPGYGDSGPQHWQTHWQRQFPNSIRVVQKDWLNVEREEWVNTVDSAIQLAKAPIVMVGHSLGASTILFWANSEQSKKNLHKIKGALLVALPDPDSEAFRALKIKGFKEIPLNKLPFHSILVASENDPFLSINKARSYAQCLGSEVISIGNQGHIGDDSKLGEWEEGKQLLMKLLA
jgi:predicted alpha/beta hydrolase family esterase